MNKLVEKTPAPKVIAIFLITFVIFSGTILALGNYYSKSAGQVAGAVDTIDQIKLADNYRLAFMTTFQNYLILDTDTNWLSEDLSAKTKEIKNTLLSLKVPAEYKDHHFKAVISIAEIEKGIDSKNLDLILPNIYKLRDLIDNF